MSGGDRPRLYPPLEQAGNAPDRSVRRPGEICFTGYPRYKNIPDTSVENIFNWDPAIYTGKNNGFWVLSIRAFPNLRRMVPCRQVVIHKPLIPFFKDFTKMIRRFNYKELDEITKELEKIQYDYYSMNHLTREGLSKYRGT